MTMLPKHFLPISAMNTPNQNFYRDLGRIFLLVMTVFIILTFEDYGITHDEEVQKVYGELLLNYYSSFFQDQSAFHYIDLYRYGGLFDMAAALLNKISPLGVYETRHLLGGLVGVVGLVGVWKLGRVLGGERVGFLALLLLALTPSFYGHSFNNPKDAPFAGAMAWTLYYICRWLKDLPAPSRLLTAKLGIAFGVALSVRVGAILTLPYIGLVFGLYLILVYRRQGLAIARTHLLAGLKSLGLALILAYAVMALFWPWAVQAPLNPFRALFDFAHLPIDLETLFDGEWVKATNLPPDYLLEYLIVKLPELILFGLVSGVVFAVLWLVRRMRHQPSPAGSAVSMADRRALQIVLIGVAAVFPIVFFMLTTPTAYNGIRHFLFVVPPMAALAALALDKVWRLAEEWKEQAGKAFSAILTVIFSLQIWLMVQLHPDQYVYYNMLVGGVKGAEGAFELDYWGNSLLEATHALEEFVINENGGTPPDQVYKVAVCGHRLSASYFFPPFLQFTKNVNEADFLVSFTQANCHRHFEGHQIITISRFNAALSVVKDRRDILAARKNNAAPVQP